MTTHLSRQHATAPRTSWGFGGSSSCLDESSHPWVPAGHPQYTGASHSGRLWMAQQHSQTQRVQTTTKDINMVVMCTTAQETGELKFYSETQPRRLGEEGGEGLFFGVGGGEGERGRSRLFLFFFFFLFFWVWEDCFFFCFFCFFGERVGLGVCWGVCWRRRRLGREGGVLSRGGLVVVFVCVCVFFFWGGEEGRGGFW